MATLLKSLVPDMPDEYSEPEQALLRIYEQMEEKDINRRESLGSVGALSPIHRDVSLSPLTKRMKSEKRDSFPATTPLSPTLAKQYAMKQIADGKLVINKDTKSKGFKKTRSQERHVINRRESYTGLMSPCFSPYLPTAPSPLSQDTTGMHKHLSDEYRKSFIKKATLTSSFSFPSQEIIDKNQIDEECPLDDEMSNSEVVPRIKSDFLQISLVPSLTSSSKQVLSNDIIRQTFSSYGKIKTLIDKDSEEGLYLLFQDPSINQQVVNDMNNARIMGMEILVCIPDRDRAPSELTAVQISQPWTRLAAGITDTTPDEINPSGTLDSKRRETNFTYKDSPFT
ncbi:hypothetical protein LOD99_12755 [Oopsacas minuta]|uniref:RRM domain-containing protein n=1 Tax=Oopsacas minuta TaxID=111878 RepID=A0AAV7JCX9_9METZ|nr:hypothetical protein LOD99_12755 [Oopsacas minuta]